MSDPDFSLEDVARYWGDNVVVWAREVRQGHDVAREFMNNPALLGQPTGAFAPGHFTHPSSPWDPGPQRPPLRPFNPPRACSQPGGYEHDGRLLTGNRTPVYGPPRASCIRSST